eukprot:COSAG01_NODE_39193_length_479_cov_4.502632_2_plen_116_part_01
MAPVSVAVVGSVEGAPSTVRAFPGMSRGDVVKLSTYGLPKGLRVFGATRLAHQWGCRPGLSSRFAGALCAGTFNCCIQGYTAGARQTTSGQLLSGRATTPRLTGCGASCATHFRRG